MTDQKNPTQLNDNNKAKDQKSTTYKNLIDQISKLNLKELKQFVTELQNYFEINPDSLVVASAGGSAPQENKNSEVNVVLTEVGKNKIAVIKAISKLTGKGLLDSKKMLDNLPLVVAEKQNEENAKKLKDDLLAAGAVVELK